jgi:hypothetical protein
MSAQAALPIQVDPPPVDPVRAAQAAASRAFWLNVAAKAQAAAPGRLAERQAAEEERRRIARAALLEEAARAPVTNALPLFQAANASDAVLQQRRNDLCQCGSGKKFKRCCASEAPEGSTGSVPEATGTAGDGRFPLVHTIENGGTEKEWGLLGSAGADCAFSLFGAEHPPTHPAVLSKVKRKKRDPRYTPEARARRVELRGKVAAIERQLGRSTQAFRLEKCETCSWLWHMDAQAHAPVVDNDNRPLRDIDRCRHRLCPECARIRAAKNAAAVTAKILAAFENRDQPPALLSTTQNDTKGESKASGGDRHREGIKRLRNMERFKRYVNGGVMAMEMPRNVTHEWWHDHTHALLDCTYYPQAELLWDWRVALWNAGGHGEEIVELWTALEWPEVGALWGQLVDPSHDAGLKASILKRLRALKMPTEPRDGARIGRAPWDPILDEQLVARIKARLRELGAPERPAGGARIERVKARSGETWEQTVERAAHEVMKYTVKGFFKSEKKGAEKRNVGLSVEELYPSELHELVEWMYGKHFVTPFGCLRGVEIDEDDEEEKELDGDGDEFIGHNLITGTMVTRKECVGRNDDEAQEIGHALNCKVGRRWKDESAKANAEDPKWGGFRM